MAILLLRIVNQARWTGRADDAQAVRKAAGDLQLRGVEIGLSVFALETPAASRELATRFALIRRSVDPIDSIVFEETLVRELGMEVVATTDEHLDPTLSGRHREIRGLTPALAERLAEAILASAHRNVERISKGEIAQFGASLCRADPELRTRLKPDWEARIAPLL